MTRPASRVRYNVATSLDGYIADRGGGFGWIPPDPDVDFAALFRSFGAVVMGRRSYEATRDAGGLDQLPPVPVSVISRTLDPGSDPRITVVSHEVEAHVRGLRRTVRGDVWLFGGGELFRLLLAAELVDRVEVAIVPVLLGGGVPLLPAPASGVRLALDEVRRYDASGIVQLGYEVRYTAP